MLQRVRKLVRELFGRKPKLEQIEWIHDLLKNPMQGDSRGVIVESYSLLLEHAATNDYYCENDLPCAKEAVARA